MLAWPNELTPTPAEIGDFGSDTETLRDLVSDDDVDNESVSSFGGLAVGTEVDMTVTRHDREDFTRRWLNNE
jgi:hypothetical protein